MISSRNADPNAEQMYLDLLKLCLTRILFPDSYGRLRPGLTRSWGSSALWKFYSILDGFLDRYDLRLLRLLRFDDSDRIQGRQWPPPPEAETMIGLERLNHLEMCIRSIQAEKIPGDLIETGVWRGGATIFMRAVLRVMGDTERTVWVADSFEGLPEPRKPEDLGDTLYSMPEFAVSVDTVRANFVRYGLLDDQVKFLKGWFRDTLPTAPIGALSIVRLDGDMYESTMDALTSLYHKLSLGGYLIVDDFNLPGCRLAVHEFRANLRIVDPLERIDWASVFWRKHHY